MQIVNPELNDKLMRAQPIRLNIGCGGEPREGFYGVDIRPGRGVDIVADLNTPLHALPDDSVSEIYSAHTLEHICKFPELMRELHRIVRADGCIEVLVPHFSNPYAYSDPTHVRFFGLFSMHYFVDEQQQPGRSVPNYWPGIRFHLDEVRLRFWGPRRGRSGWFERLVNHSWLMRRIYERYLCSPPYTHVAPQHINQLNWQSIPGLLPERYCL